MAEPRPGVPSSLKLMFRQYWYWYLDVGDGAAGVGRDAEGLVEAVDPDGRLPAALPMILVQAEAVLAHEAGRGQQLLPVPVLVPLMQGDGGGRQLHAHAGNHEQLLGVPGGGQVDHPLGGIDHVLDIGVQPVRRGRALLS